jgi:hypothetical protein
MALAEVGEVIIVPFNLVVQVDGFDNTLETQGKEGTVLQRQVSDITEEGEEIFNYFLQFQETFDLLNSSGIVEISTDSFWFTEDSLDPTTDTVPSLPLTTQEINSLIRQNQSSLNRSFSEGQSFLNRIPQNDPIFRAVAEDIFDTLSRNRSVVQGIRYNERDDDSVSNITAELDGSTLLADDGIRFSTFLEVLQTQQQVVAQRTSELTNAEEQSGDNFSRSNESSAAAENRFLETLENQEEITFIPQGVTSVDWDTIEPDIPTADDILPATLTPAQEAAQLFPLLDSSEVVSSGLV